MGTAVMEKVAAVLPTEAVGMSVVIVTVDRGTTETETGEDLTMVECAGQFVIVDAQLVIVISLVEYFVS